MKPNQFLQKTFFAFGLTFAFGVAIISSCTKEGIRPSAQEKSTFTTEAATAPGPTVSFTFPKNGATLSDSITIKIKATDSVAITSVELKVDGVSLGTKTAAPYNFGWNTKTVLNGTHLLLAKAVNASGNSTTKKI